MVERDLRWTEWVRRRQEDILKGCKHLERRWRTDAKRETSDHLRARWLMWTLTSTVRSLRDHATRALYWFGSSDPDTLFALNRCTNRGESVDVHSPDGPHLCISEPHQPAQVVTAETTCTAFWPPHLPLPSRTSAPATGAIPPRPLHPHSAWPYRRIQGGAKLIHCVRDTLSQECARLVLHRWVIGFPPARRSGQPRARPHARRVGRCGRASGDGSSPGGRASCWRAR